MPDPASTLLLDGIWSLEIGQFLHLKAEVIKLKLDDREEWRRGYRPFPRDFWER